MTEETISQLQGITLQVALIIAVVFLWFELKTERKTRDTQFLQYATQLQALATAQTKLIEQTNEAMRFTVNLLKDRSDLPVLSTQLPEVDVRTGQITHTGS